jgi:hypothetical protein
MHAEFEVGVSFADAVGLAVCERRTDPKATIRINAKSRTGKADRRGNGTLEGVSRGAVQSILLITRTNSCVALRALMPRTKAK